ncbi:MULTISPECIES: SGNH hydrolase domain-containing protein [Gammaproteobacteria]|uniref:SGNH hydrolase domain-containing protein n=1 Tax=Gammaproteobacteria TaxID=1236 RepID=UPI0014026C26|nr:MULTISPECIES: SGNH hydrolase domain-containing protein [Gammaproteobacteria]
MLVRKCWLGFIALAMVACAAPQTGFVAAQIDEAQRYLPENDLCIDSSLRAKQLTSHCVFGMPNLASDADFAVIGDSHAMVLMDAVKTLAEEHTLTGMNLTMSGCPPFEFAVRSPAREKDVQCEQFRGHILEAARAGALPKELIIHARWGIHFSATRFNNGEGGLEPEEYQVFATPETATLGHEQALSASLESILLELLDSNYNVIFVHSVPEMGWNVGDELRSLYVHEGTLDRYSASVSLQSYMTRNQGVMDTVAKVAQQFPNQLQQVFPHEYFCDRRKERCFAHFQGAPLYYDDDHVSTVGAYILVQELGIFNEF